MEQFSFSKKGRFLFYPLELLQNYPITPKSRVDERLIDMNERDSVIEFHFSLSNSSFTSGSILKDNERANMFPANSDLTTEPSMSKPNLETQEEIVRNRNDRDGLSLKGMKFYESESSFDLDCALKTTEVSGLQYKGPTTEELRLYERCLKNYDIVQSIARSFCSAMREIRKKLFSRVMTNRRILENGRVIRAIRDYYGASKTLNTDQNIMEIMELLLDIKDGSIFKSKKWSKSYFRSFLKEDKISILYQLHHAVASESNYYIRQFVSFELAERSIEYYKLVMNYLKNPVETKLKN